MSHGDKIEQMPRGFLAIAHTDNTPSAAMKDEKRRLYGVQFHPEVVHTPKGRRYWVTLFYHLRLQTDLDHGQFH